MKTQEAAEATKDKNNPWEHEKESIRIATEIVVLPGQLDIVSGQGRQSKESVGYLPLRNLIEKHYDAYQVQQ
jgi:hypothetical protein